MRSVCGSARALVCLLFLGCGGGGTGPGDAGGTTPTCEAECQRQKAGGCGDSNLCQDICGAQRRQFGGCPSQYAAFLGCIARRPDACSVATECANQQNALLACAADAGTPQPRCGDGSCSSSESCSSCPQDCTSGCGVPDAGPGPCVPQCGARVCGSNGCGGQCGAGCATGRTCAPDGLSCLLPSCTACSQCASAEVCLGGRCISPWGRDYQVTFRSGVYPLRRPDGSCWDGFVTCSIPDPSIGVRVDSAGAYQGISCGTDTITPVWSGSAVVTLNASSALDFRLVDSDDVGCGLTTNTGACDFAFSGMALRDLICEGGYDGSVANVAMCEGMSVTFDVDPL